MGKEIIKVEVESISTNEIVPLIQRHIESVREDIKDNPYILEAIKVLNVGGYRSAIGCFWNAVVDDLRNKIMTRSLSLFNKSMNLKREIKSYEDFQNYVNDDELIDGAYKIGVITWEAHKVLKHSKETRHIFDGHPKSSQPSIIKVLAMFDDCIKYVLNVDYPLPIIDLDEYLTILGDNNFDRNTIGIENAFSELPEIYQNELINRLFTAYIHKEASSILRSNIELVAPILWNILAKDIKVQVVRRIDQEISKSDKQVIEQAFQFVNIVDGIRYLTNTSKKYIVKPLIDELNKSLDEWSKENRIVQELEPYSSIIPPEMLFDYVSALTHTFVGHIGYSAYAARTDFYANGAALKIPNMFASFDDRAAQAFIETIRTSYILSSRIMNSQKLRRLRTLGKIVNDRVSKKFQDKKLLELLVDETKEKEFFKTLPKING